MVAVLVAPLAALPFQLLLDMWSVTSLLVAVALVAVLRVVLRVVAARVAAGAGDRPERVLNCEGVAALAVIWGYPSMVVLLFIATTGFSEFLALVRILFCCTVLPMVGIFFLAVAMRALSLTPGMLVRGAVGTAGSIRGVSLHSALQQRGYEWLTPDQAGELWQLAGEASFALPPWEMVGTLPGVDEGDLKSLARIVKLLKARPPR